MNESSLPTDSPLQPAPTSTLSLWRILIVDDESKLLEALQSALSARGFIVHTAASAGAGLAALEQEPPDLLLTDLMLPDMNGIDLMTRAREIDPHLVTVMMTGNATVQSAVDAMKQGAFDYLMKPFKLAALYPVLTRALEVRRLSLENLQLREMLAVYELGQTIGQTRDLQAVLNSVAEGALRQVEGNESSVMLATPDGKELLIAAVKGEGREGLLGERIPMEIGVAGWVARTRQPLLLAGTVNDPRFEPVQPRTEIQAAVSMPMLSGNKLIGVLNVNSTESSNRFTVGRAKALSILCNMAASVVEGATLYAEARQAADSLAVAEAKYRSIFENAVEGIFQSTPDGHYLSANPALASMCGYDTPEELMSAITDIAHQFYVDPKRRGEFQQALTEQDAIYGFESQAYRKDGSIILISESARAIRDVNGNLLYYEGTTEDITARKQSEDALRDSNLQLQTALDQVRAAQNVVVEQERLRALGQMASGIAHDFNNALGPILGFSEIMLMNDKGLEDREKVKRNLEIINTAARDAASIVSRLREFYRKREEGDEFLPVDLNQMVEQAVALTQPRWKDQAQARGVSIVVVRELDRVPLIAGVAPELRELLTNLIFNAVDAMPRGGTITVTTAEEGAATGKRVVLSVEDTGVGMTEEVRAHCLDPFFSTKGEHGTGLGLAMVVGIVERHEGTIALASKLDLGTRFTIRFPASADDFRHAVETARSPLRSLRILVVDDEPLLCEALREYLRAEGHRVEVAESGRAALEQFRAGEFDVVLTDRAMPGMNGDELAAIIHQLAPGLPVIMITGFGDLMKHAGELPLGVTSIVGKPVTLAALRKALTEVA